MAGESFTVRDIERRLAALEAAGGGATHGSTHAAGNSDPVTLTEAQITNLVADLAAKQDTATLSETVDDRVAALLVAGNSITLTYNDGANTLTIDQGGAWTTTFDPVLSQGASSNIAHTVSKSQWHYDGDMVEWEGRFDATASGTAGSSWTTTLPVAALVAGNNCNGSAMIYDSSANLAYICACQTGSTTTMNFYTDQVAGGGPWGVSPNVAVATGDQMRFIVRYRWR